MNTLRLILGMLTGYAFAMAAVHLFDPETGRGRVAAAVVGGALAAGVLWLLEWSYR